MIVQTVSIRGNKPLRLDRPELVHRVRSGRVDLFLVRLDNGEPGPRCFVAHLEPNDLLFGLLPSAITVDTDYALLAYGRGEAVLEAHDAIPPGAETSVTAWVDRLSQRVVDKNRPPAMSIIFEDAPLDLPAAGTLRTAEDLSWLRVTHGEARFLGQDPLPIDQPFPLTARSWLTVTAPTALIPDPPDTLLPALTAFTQFICILLLRAEQVRASNEQGRLTLAREHEKAAVSASMQRLGRILTPKGIPALDAARSPLWAACRLVAQEAGITLPPEPRDRIPESMDDIARLAGFRTRAVVLKGTWWTRNCGPLLACLDQEDRPVALIPRDSGGYSLVDPVTGTVQAVNPAIAATLLRTAFMFYRPFPSRPLTPRDVLRFGLFRSRRDIMALILLGAMSALLGLLTPIATSQLVGVYIPQASHLGAVHMSLILGGAALAMAGFGFIKGLAQVRLESRADLHLQAAVWDRLLSLPAPFFRQFSAGDLAVRSMGFAAMRQLLSGVTLNALLAMLFSSANLFWLFYYDWSMALVAQGLTGLGVLVTLACGAGVVARQRKVIDIQGKLSGTVLQYVTGINKLRMTSAENRALACWATDYARQREHAFAAGRITAVLTAFNAMFPVVASAVLFSWLFWVRPAALSVPDFVAFNTAFAAFLGSFLQISSVISNTAYLAPLYERARPILETAPEYDEAKAKPGPLHGSVTLRHVSFRYAPDGPPILRDVNMEAKSGEFIAIVGGSGAGKSTLLRLLLGFEEPEAGDIFFDDQELKNVDVREVRRQIGVVLQDGKLMSGDMFTNIVGSSSLTMDDAWDAAGKVGLAEDIKRMPMGMHTMVPAGGGTLSGGQRQRLLIARAIARKPRLLFFDEATSALDNKTQAIVAASLEQLHVTRVVIAHRLSTILNADRIYVMEHGKVVECGTYAELMATKGHFYALAKRQLV